MVARPEPGTPAVAAPVEWVRAVGDLRLPARADARLQDLMDRNNDGLLDAAERAELEALAEVGESIALVRAGALRLLGRDPR